MPNFAQAITAGNFICLKGTFFTFINCAKLKFSIKFVPAFLQTLMHERYKNNFRPTPTLLHDIIYSVFPAFEWKIRKLLDLYRQPLLSQARGRFLNSEIIRNWFLFASRSQEDGKRIITTRLLLAAHKSLQSETAKKCFFAIGKLKEAFQ